MKMLEVILKKRDAILAVAAKHGARNVRVFGSVARQEETEQSDVDLLVEAEEETSSWFPAGLMLDLEVLLGRHVQIITDEGLNPRIRDLVLKEAREI